MPPRMPVMPPRGGAATDAATDAAALRGHGRVERGDWHVAAVARGDARLASRRG